MAKINSNIIILGSGSFTEKIIPKLAIDFNIQAVYSTTREASPTNRGEIDKLCSSLLIKYHEIEDINSVCVYDQIKKYNPDVILSSWHKIIKNPLLNLPKYGIIGTHPTSLPIHRGRHPLHWLIALGYTSSSLSYFIMDEGIDTGQLINQFPYKIGGMNIKELEDEVNNLAIDTCSQVIKKVINNNSHKNQNNKINSGLSSYLRARTEHDTILDPRLNIKTVSRLVKSYSEPYAKAKLIINSEVLQILSVQIIDNHKYNIDVEYGYIYEINSKYIIVKFYDGILKLRFENDRESILDIPIGYKIHPPSYYENINIISST